jgi:hypothetical protein
MLHKAEACAYTSCLTIRARHPVMAGEGGRLPAVATTLRQSSTRSDLG